MTVDKTVMYDLGKDEQKNVKDIMSAVYMALKDKGYNPVNQIVGYFLSGDPTYITNHNDARALISGLETNEILEEMIDSYLAKLMGSEKADGE